MKKSVKYAAAAGLLVLLCAVGVYGTFFAARNIGCAVDDSFSWKAYSYTPVTSGTLYNYAFPSEEITLSAENRETIAKLLAAARERAVFRAVGRHTVPIPVCRAPFWWKPRARKRTTSSFCARRRRQSSCY